MICRCDGWLLIVSVVGLYEGMAMVESCTVFGVAVIVLDLICRFGD